MYSSAQVRSLDQNAIVNGGIPAYTLMQRAGAACWREIAARWPQAQRIDVLCGPGNNGGDGYVVARLAQQAGREVRVWTLGSVREDSPAFEARRDWSGATAEYIEGALCGTDLIVDAMLGIGVCRALEGAMRTAVLEINRAAARVPVFAVDVPSGLDADTGRVQGCAVQAWVTMSFIGRKLGLYTGAGPAHAGRVLFDDLQAVPAAPAGIATLLGAGLLRAWLPARPRDAHKGCNGHVLLIGGDKGMGGAVMMAARAALRSGAGLVSVATRASHAATLTAAQPEVMFHAVERPDGLQVLLGRASVLALGPGLGRGSWAQAMWSAATASALPLVMDADALNLLADRQLRRDWMLTPHPGEAARLLGCSAAQVNADRAAAVHQIQARYGGVVVLKGAGSLIQGDSLAVCPYGNPGMATGGMGDALTGVIAALRAQGLDDESAAQAGVMVHALAADRAAQAGERGLLPGDLIAELRAIVNPVPPR